MLTVQQSELLSRSDVARRLDVSEWQVRSLERRGELPAIRVGMRTVKYRGSDVEAFIERRRVEPNEV